MKDQQIEKAMDGIENRIRHIYNCGYQQGYEDGKKANMVDTIKQSDFSYQRGLEDAWECARKIAKEYIQMLKSLFGTVDISKIFLEYTATEVMQKIKEYEERQNVKKIYEEKFMPIGKANMEKRREERQTEIKCDTCKYEGSSFSPCIKCKDNSEFHRIFENIISPIHLQYISNISPIHLQFL